jgi:DNA-binding transcriptional LysR family regulator
VEFRQVEYFLAVAEEESFSRAAGRLHVVQSAVSAAVRRLERELGCPLFDRSARRVTLTDAGAALLPEARATLDAMRAAREAVDQVRGGLRGTIDLGTMTSIGIVDLPGLLGDFHVTHPEVVLRLHVAPSGSLGLARSLLDGELDVALLSLPRPTPAGLLARELAASPLRLVVREDHRLAGWPGVSLSELTTEQFIDSPPGYGNRVVADRAFAAAGLDRRVALEITDIKTTARFVQHGLGVAFVPAFAAPTDPDLRVLPVTDAAMRWSLSVATSAVRRPGAALRALLALVDTYMDPPDGRAAEHGP